MSPEQLRGEPPAAATDLYALGITLFELLTGERPFPGGSDFEVAEKHLRQTPRPVRSVRPKCPRWLAAFVARLLEKHPRDRWADGRTALAALRRRRAPRWRVWRRRAGVVTAGGVALAIGWWAIGRAQPRVVEAVPLGHRLIAVSGDGDELWSRELPNRVCCPLVADVAPSRGSEVVAAVREIDPTTGVERAVAVVLSSRGRELDRFVIDSGELRHWYPHLSEDLQIAGFEVGDLDGDGLPEVVWRACHPRWYPELVGVWWGRRGGRLETLLVNSGRIHDVATGDITGDSLAEIVVTGLNNPLGYQYVVAALEVGRRLVAPDLLSWTTGDDRRAGAAVAYLLLGTLADPPLIEAVDRNRVVLRTGDTVRELYPAGSPKLVGSARVTAEMRSGFWTDLSALCRDLAVQHDLGDDRVRALEEKHAAVLLEPGPRLAADLLVARGFARAGDHERAVDHLRATILRDPDLVDPWLRLGEQLLIAGHRDAGRDALRRSMVDRTVGRNPYDAILFLTLDAALHGDHEGLEEARRFWASYNSRGGVRNHFEPLEPLAKFFAGQWADSRLAAPSERVSLYRPVEVVVPWARLERGAEPAGIAEVAEDLARDAEIAEPAELLRAAALLRIGRTGKAVEVSDRTLRVLAERGREHYEQFIWVPLAEWVYGTALEASGRGGEARPHFERAARLAPEAWFARGR